MNQLFAYPEVEGLWKRLLALLRKLSPDPREEVPPEVVIRYCPGLVARQRWIVEIEDCEQITCGFFDGPNLRSALAKAVREAQSAVEGL